MNVNDLSLMRNHCVELLTSSLMNFVLEHGEDMSDYFLNEHGIYESNVLKVLDLASNGCYFSVPIKYNTDGKEEDYEHHAFWSLYVVEDETEGLVLKYYQLFNEGFTYDDEESNPDHGYVTNLSLAQIEYIYCHVVDVFKKS